MGRSPLLADRGVLVLQLLADPGTLADLGVLGLRLLGASANAGKGHDPARESGNTGIISAS